jgi:hypothetical protein
VKLNGLDPLGTLQKILLSANKNLLPQALAPPHKQKPIPLGYRNNKINPLAFVIA